MYIYNYIYVHSILEDIISYLLTLATLTHLRLGSRNFPVPCFSSAKKKKKNQHAFLRARLVEEFTQPGRMVPCLIHG